MARFPHNGAEKCENEWRFFSASQSSPVLTDMSVSVLLAPHASEVNMLRVVRELLMLCKLLERVKELVLVEAERDALDLGRDIKRTARRVW